MPITVDLGFVRNPEKPVLPFSLDVFETQCADKHQHPRAQLIYSLKGTMKVIVKNSIWLVSSNQAIWVPSMYEHQVFFLKDNYIRNLFIDDSFTHLLPDKCFTLDVSPFLKEMIIKVVSIGDQYILDSPEGRLIMVMLDELATVKPTKTFLPISNDRYLKKVMDVLINDPSDKRTIEEFAEIACLSPRSLARLFVKEVGLTFGDWRKQVRLMAAIEKIEKGESITQISFDLGYNSPSAFVEMFRKAFGVSPGSYLKD